MDIKDLKPSELIRVALNDLSTCDRDPRYFIHMGTWHGPVNSGTYMPSCGVCLAGAVMAMRMHCNHRFSFEPKSFSSEYEDVLTALNLFRIGNVAVALDVLGLPSRGIADYYRIAPYTTDRMQFQTDLLNLADDLANVGY